MSRRRAVRWAAILLIAGCGRPAREEAPMTMAPARAGAGAPPIDGEAPTTLQTATFALG